jgi:hypothetical protein
MSGVPIFNKVTEEIINRVEGRLQPFIDQAETARAATLPLRLRWRSLALLAKR